VNTEHDTTFEEQSIAKFTEEDSGDGINEEFKTEEKESGAVADAATAAGGEGGNASSDDEEDEGSKSGAKNGDDEGSAGNEVNYALYQAVWGVQKWLKKPNLSLASPAEWTAFTKDANVVLKAFESRAFKAHELAQGRTNYLSKREAPLPPTAGGGGGANRNSSSTSGMNSTPGKGRGGDKGSGASGEGAASCKYLTASRLLRLQVRTCVDTSRAHALLYSLSFGFLHEAFRCRSFCQRPLFDHFLAPLLVVVVVVVCHFDNSW